MHLISIHVRTVKSHFSFFLGPRTAAQGRVPGTRGGGQVARGAVPGDGGSEGLGECVYVD